MICAWRKYFSIFFILIVGVPAFAQTFRGTVSGTVVDAQNAAVANADVQLTNPATGATLRAKSSASGEFNFPELPVGTYELTVGANGFQTRKIAGIDVAVTKTVNFPVVLSVGSETTVIDVTANDVQTDTESAALVSVIDSKSVQELALKLSF